MKTPPHRPSPPFGSVDWVLSPEGQRRRDLPLQVLDTDCLYPEDTLDPVIREELRRCYWDEKNGRKAFGGE